MSNASNESGLCAVDECKRRGSPQVCPYDQQYHHHGRIHYGSPGTPADMKFRAGAWRQVCAEHYDMLRRAREAWESRATEVNS